MDDQKNPVQFVDIWEASKAGSHVLILPFKVLFLILWTSTLVL